MSREPSAPPVFRLPVSSGNAVASSFTLRVASYLDGHVGVFAGVLFVVVVLLITGAGPPV